VTDHSSTALASHRAKVTIPRILERPWEPVLLEGGVRGPAKKTLSTGTGGSLSRDPTFGVTTWLGHSPPGWSDDELVYHPCVEEVFFLDGVTKLADRTYSHGHYLYRPPGILHGPAGSSRYDSRTNIYRFGSAADTLLRYDGDEFPNVDSQPVTDEHEDWPVPWVEQLDSNQLPWSDVNSGPWQGARHKWLSRNRVTGGGTLLIDIPAGWSGAGSPAHGTIEEFVVEGELSMGGQWFEKWGYACRPAGDPARGYEALGGACLICFWDENELEH
jgi:hypothetical protein